MILITFFVISQIVMFIAMIFDFLSFQYKQREHTFLCLAFSSSLISAHYFLLNKTAAGIIVFFAVLRFITCCFTIKKKYLIMFLMLNTIALFVTYKEIYDIIVYIGIFVLIIGNFQEDNRKMRKIMMLGTSIIILYNLIIFSPVGVIAKCLFLLSGFIGYYRFYFRKQKIVHNLNLNQKTHNF